MTQSGNESMENRRMTAQRRAGTLKAVVAAASLALVSGCASVSTADPRDPIEGFNRAMYAFNDGFDNAIAKPVATAYVNVIPNPIRERVRNFFANLADLFIGVNNLLQGKPADAGTDFARLAFNTTFGIFGIHDVATEFGLEKHDEDFGQTFGRWGAGDGFYVVWPILGSSTLRDSIGGIVDVALDPVRRIDHVRTRNSLFLIRGVQTRADLLSASRILEEAALDKYVFQRDAYLQRRRNQIFDGAPPRAERERASAD